MDISKWTPSILCTDAMASLETSAPSACYMWSIYSTEMSKQDSIKGYWVAYVFFFTQAKEHNITE